MRVHTMTVYIEAAKPTRYNLTRPNIKTYIWGPNASYPNLGCSFKTGGSWSVVHSACGMAKNREGVGG